jgi:signal recognition particle subunit SRP54
LLNAISKTYLKGEYQADIHLFLLIIAVHWFALLLYTIFATLGKAPILKNRLLMFESLSERLDSAFKQLKGEGRISEINVASTVKEIRRALVDADVNYKIAKDFTDRVREKALGEKVITAISPSQLMVKIVKDELAELMGGAEAELDIKSNPSIILIAGLQGSGKTTFSGKLANFLKTKKGKKPLLVAADIYRPAAIDQLKVLGEQIGVDVYSEPENKNAVQIAQNAIQHAKQNNYNVIIIDTAGRLAVDEVMMTEVANIKTAVKPNEILFVVDAMTGQDAVNTAKAFNERLDFSGVVLTKLDGDTRGGAALTIKYTVEKPIKFVSMGEKLDTLDVFYPERMAQRILGMGDITTLVERAQEQFNEEQAKKLEKKIRQNQFDFDDFREQLQQIKKMGNLKDLMGMIPGVGKAIKDLDISDDAFKGIEAMIGSMTPQERGNPDVIDGSRRKRIAKGAGKEIQDVNQFMKQFDQMRQMMKMMNKFGTGGKGLKALGR